MGFYGYKSSVWGVPGLGGFSGYELDIVGGMRFDEAWSANDWRQNQWGGYYASEYTPLPSFIIERARQKWPQLQDHIDANSPLKNDYQNRMNTYRSNIEAWAEYVDGITRSGEYGQGRMQTGNRVMFLTEINKAVREIADLNIPDPYAAIEEAEAAAEAQRVAAEAAAKADAARQKAAADAAKAAQAKAAADAAAAAAKLQQTQESIAQAKAAVAAATQAKAVAEASAQRNRELQVIASQKSAMTVAKTPWILGGLAVLTAGAIYFARRKKK